MNKTQVQILRKTINYRNFCQRITKEMLNTNKSSKRTTFGQPTYETHPHLIKQDEVTPLIKRSEFQERRQKLMEQIVTYVRERHADVDQHLIIIPSSSKQYMTERIPYIFRQNTDFLYFTGCQEPDSCLVLSLDTNKSTQVRSVLFVRDKDEHAELWDGPRTGPEVATKLFGVDTSLPTSDLENFLQLHLKNHRSCSLWYDFMNPASMEVQKIMSECLLNLNRKTWESPKIFMHKQRLIKSQAEIELMQKSCSIGSEAIAETIKKSRPGINEHEIFANVDYECRVRGAEFLAYPPVVAGGNRANIIHYISNNQVVKDGEMVLMDAGCECHGYASDITRTWPINGRFSSEQKEIYEIVLKVQKDLINLCAKFPTLDELFDSMCVLLGKELQKVGLISKSLSSQSLMRASHEFCPHHVAHYLGMDVHDTGMITRRINIKPGMVITIEPGIYISDKLKQVPQELCGLGVRIEDDVLVTENGPVVLTRSCPKEIADLENLCRAQSS